MSAPAPNKAASSNAAALQMLMTLENEALDATDLIALRHIAVNHPRALIQSGHIFWISRRGHKVKLDAMSSQSKLDKTTPFVQWMIRQLNDRAQRGDLNTINQWQFDRSNEDTPFTYPFIHALYAPLAPSPHSGGLLFTREFPFKEIDRRLAARLAKIFGLAATATPRKRHRNISLNKRVALWGGTALLALLAAIPVPMTTLAPAEIVSGKAHVITAPFDGVIKDVLVPPNTQIDKNTPLLRFVETAYRNDLILAEKEHDIADAKLRQARVNSSANETPNPQIAIAEAEKALASARRDFVQDRLSKTIIAAPKKGLAIYSSSTEWKGRRVTTGEVLMQIADKTDLRLRIEAPLSMGESLAAESRIKLFLDNAPLNAFEAELTSASYYAKPLTGGHMAYEAYAELQIKEGQALPRIGARGVAKIYGKKAPFGYWLLRRPITILRQTFGV